MSVLIKVSLLSTSSLRFVLCSGDFNLPTSTFPVTGLSLYYTLLSYI